MKYKKRGKPANMVKNKEQVRHFYYRTWHKISKHIDFANGEFPLFHSCLGKTTELTINPIQTELKNSFFLNLFSL